MGLGKAQNICYLSRTKFSFNMKLKTTTLTCLNLKVLKAPNKNKITKFTVNPIRCRTLWEDAEPFF